MNDREIREALCSYLETTCEKIRFFDELVIGDCRADIVAISDMTRGYEIKSDADSYERLKKQVRFYDKFFELNYLVIGKRHSASAAKHIPEYWGIVHIGEDGSVEVRREAKPCKKFKLLSQLSLLWRSELGNMQLLNKLPKYLQKSRKFVCEKLIEKVDPDTLMRQFRDEMFERDYTYFED